MLWDAVTGKLPRTFPPQSPEVGDGAFTGDGTSVAVSSDETILIYGVQDGIQEPSLTGSECGVRGLVVGTDGSLLASKEAALRARAATGSGLGPRHRRPDRDRTGRDHAGAHGRGVPLRVTLPSTLRLAGRRFD